MKRAGEGERGGKGARGREGERGREFIIKMSSNILKPNIIWNG